jgi:hypothetical protein
MLVAVYPTVDNGRTKAKKLTSAKALKILSHPTERP